MSRSASPLIAAALVALLALGLPLAGCSPSGEAGGEAGDKPRVVATTTMLTDLAGELGGDDVVVSGIMKPGGDPHLYQPTPSDARLIARSDMVVTNGLKLEGWIDDLVRNAGGDSKVVVATDGIEPLKDPSRTNYPDPHVWHDVGAWSTVADNVRDALIELDPANKSDYEERAAAYKARLKALDGWVKTQVGTIPAERRVLVTSHDAFQYFGRAYGLEVVAVQGISTESEAGARDVARTVDLVRDKKVPAVFVETSVNPKLVEQISRETGAEIGGTLFSDSLGAEPPTNTYEGMIRANTERIVNALKPRS